MGNNASQLAGCLTSQNLLSQAAKPPLGSSGGHSQPVPFSPVPILPLPPAHTHIQSSISTTLGEHFVILKRQLSKTCDVSLVS